MKASLSRSHHARDRFGASDETMATAMSKAQHKLHLFLESVAHVLRYGGGVLLLLGLCMMLGVVGRAKNAPPISPSREQLPMKASDCQIAP